MALTFIKQNESYLLVSSVHVGDQHFNDVVPVVKVGVCLQDLTQAPGRQHRQRLCKERFKLDRWIATVIRFCYKFLIYIMTI